MRAKDKTLLNYIKIISLGLSIGRNLELDLGWAYVEFSFFMADLFSYPSYGLVLSLCFSYREIP